MRRHFIHVFGSSSSFLGQVNALMHTSGGLALKKQNGSIKNSAKGKMKPEVHMRLLTKL